MLEIEIEIGDDTASRSGALRFVATFPFARKPQMAQISADGTRIKRVGRLRDHPRKLE